MQSYYTLTSACTLGTDESLYGINPTTPEYSIQVELRFLFTSSIASYDDETTLYAAERKRREWQRRRRSVKASRRYHTGAAGSDTMHATDKQRALTLPPNTFEKAGNRYTMRVSIADDGGSSSDTPSTPMNVRRRRLLQQQQPLLPYLSIL